MSDYLQMNISVLLVPYRNQQIHTATSITSAAEWELLV